jgi:NAD(P)-dependent dehydrogenase (short-subunit alcohol dehydrogenase family)
MTVTRRFAGQGDMVFVVERHELRERIAGMGHERIHFVGADVADEASVERAIKAVLDAGGQLDVLVNVVGGYAAGQPIDQLDAATWDGMMTLNLRTAFLMSKHGVRPMIERGWGRIINFSARAARDTSANAGAYAVSKAGIIALTEVQAKEVLDRNITVNAILPSIVDTPANRQAMPQADFDRWPKADEIADVIVFLASDAARLISGASIPVYGRG